MKLFNWFHFPIR